MSGRALGVVLFQLGGPDSLEAVEPFLFNLFCDPDIIDFPFARLARQPLARLIARNRARHVRQRYAAIGGKSPIIDLTLRQARALEAELQKTLAARVVVAMRYWHPRAEDALRELQPESLSELVLLPLYPQYSSVTSGSSLNDWNRHWNSTDSSPPTRLVRHFHDHPLYIEALVERINGTLARFPAGESVHLLFSAHGVPLSVIEKGDPYQQQVEATTRRVLAAGGWKHPTIVCYQSRVGPGRWLEPSLTESITTLAKAGRKNLLVVPVSFVTDHVETLHEIAVEARELAGKLGVFRFELMPALNDSPKFIAALADLVHAALKREPTEPPRVS